VTSIVASRRLASLPPGRERNELARDAYSYLHFPMVAGVVLTAFALKNTLSHINDPLHLVPAAALGGGVALYLLASVAFKRRAVEIWSVHRLVTALILLALIPVFHEVPALGALAGVVVVLVLLIAYETLRFAQAREEERAHLHEHQHDHEHDHNNEHDHNHEHD
jgi:low temperature requirement protein LtrA